MKSTVLFFVLIFTAIFFTKAFATDLDTATHTIGQKNYQYDYYGLVKGVDKPAYVVIPKPFSDSIIPQRHSHQDQNSTYLHGNDTYIIHFDFGSSELSRTEKQKLYRLATITSKKQVVSVTGYTCPAGTFEVNNQLAWDRARKVASWLKKHGIKVQRISGKPKCCYASDTHLAKNRRVEIVFNPKPTSPN